MNLRKHYLSLLIGVHPVFHARLPLRGAFAMPGCVICRLGWRLMPVPDEAFADRSSIQLAEMELDEAGEIRRRGVEMSVTVQRQLDDLDPEVRAAVMAAIEQLRKP